MTLIDDWKHILRHAWSVRWLAAATVFQGLDAAAPALQGYIAPEWFAAASFICSAAALLTRFLAQPELTNV